MTLNRHIIAFLAASFAMLSMTPSASADLLFFSINGSESAPVFLTDLTTGDNSRTLAIRVRDTGSGSSGSFLDTFGFRLKVLNSAVAKITSVQFPGTIGTDYITAVGLVNTAAPPGEFAATAEAQYISTARPDVAKDSSSSNYAVGDGVLLATFTIQGVGLGTTDIVIEELTTGDGDFQTTGGSGFALRDRRGFTTDSFALPSSDPDGLGDAFTFARVTSQISAVPEPTSSALVAGGLTVAFIARWRRRKQSRVAVPA